MVFSLLEIQTSDKKLAVLVDPDKWSNVDQMSDLVSAINSSNVDLVLVGGSFMANDLFENTIAFLKRKTAAPVIIFPGNGMQISSQADGILLLSLISGRNSEFLIGQHVVAAPAIARSGISVLPTGYLLIEGGKSTAA
ncbi:MAG: geranylgeranylglyceryl/heptaprenylglyceryl phosphate synthase, partial [Crocinitomicaceae bacterium]|nr:geranylgeranylglyceryl/heptaprenylglyceryl phosphate synthase [Crocinitomicaceae bacterium]